jgi:DNA segregation ATPase FtsK/SpoIIIE, S-DNA-T family
VVPTYLRDLFGFRWALRCSTPDASDTILGRGWASQGYSAAQIDPTARGVGLLLQEGGVAGAAACLLPGRPGAG